MKVHNIMRKLLFGVLVFFIFITINSITTHARTVIEVSTEEEWLAIEEGESNTTYKIVQNIEVDELLTIPSGLSISIDLNGYTVTGTSTMIINNGTFGIKDSSSSGEGKISLASEYFREGAMIVNNGSMGLSNGIIEAELMLTGNQELHIDCRILDNNGSLNMIGGKIIGKTSVTSDKIYQTFCGIHNYQDADMIMDGGSISIKLVADVYSTSSDIHNYIYGIYNETIGTTTGRVRVYEGNFEGVFECDADVEENELYAFAIAQAGNEYMPITAVKINMTLAKATANLTGAVAGIGNFADTTVGVHTSKISVVEEEASQVLTAGIFNAGSGRILFGNNSMHHEYGTRITTSSVSGMDVAVVNSEEGILSLQNGTLSGSIGVYSMGGDVELGLEDYKVDSELIIVNGMTYSLLGNAQYIMYDGTIQGDVASETTVYIPEGCFLLGVEEDGVVKYVLTDDLTVVIGQFVTRLYQVCLNRDPDSAGLENWVSQLQKGTNTGVGVATGFIFSKEFKDMNLCNEDYVKHLYRAFLGREADSAGLDNWVSLLKRGSTRESIINGFALSREFTELCAQYGIIRGDGIAEPGYGTIAKGACSVCGEKDGVSLFVERLYRICLNREADVAGLKNWTNQLWNRTNTGRGVAYGFIFSPEFINKNHSNADYVEYLYEACLGRSSDSAGKANWVGLLEQGATRESIFDGFVGSQEFTNICNEYGIIRE